MARKVVAVGAVVLAAAVAAGARAQLDQPAKATWCTLGGWQGPTAPTPERAFASWWRTVDHDQLPHTVGTDPGHLPPTPTAADFVRDGTSYRWYVADDTWLQVDVEHPRAAGKVTSDGWTVVGANRCTRVDPPGSRPVG